MKKNLLSVIILALLIVNLIMTSVMMISVTGTNKKTAAIVTDIASILKLELNPESGGEEVQTVSLEDTATYDLPDELTIPLKKTEGDDKTHIAMVKVSIAMDTTKKDYKTYGDLSTQQSRIEGIVLDVISEYTADEAQPRIDEIQDAILEKLQSPEMYNSDFIYRVTISRMMVQ